MSAARVRPTRRSASLGLGLSLALSTPAMAQQVHQAEVAGAASVAAQVADGKAVFEVACLACHQADGKGLPGAFPPLAGSEWVDGSEASEKRLVAIVLFAYPATYDGDLALVEGDEVWVTRQGDDGWWDGERKSGMGGPAGRHVERFAHGARRIDGVRGGERGDGDRVRARRGHGPASRGGHPGRQCHRCGDRIRTGRSTQGCGGAGQPRPHGAIRPAPRPGAARPGCHSAPGCAR